MRPLGDSAGDGGRRYLSFSNSPLLPLFLHYLCAVVLIQRNQQEAKCVSVRVKKRKEKKKHKETCLDVQTEARGFYMRGRARQTEREAASLEEFKQPPCYVTRMEMTSLGQPVSRSPFCLRLLLAVNRAVRVIYCMSSNLTCQIVCVAVDIWDVRRWRSNGTIRNQIWIIFHLKCQNI